MAPVAGAVAGAVAVLFVGLVVLVKEIEVLARKLPVGGLHLAPCLAWDFRY